MKGTFIFFTILIVCTFTIGYPFFSIKYFESQLALNFTWKYFLPPILLVVSILAPILYFKKIKPIDRRPNSKLKSNLKDFFSCLFLIISISATLFGVTFSTIITTNSILGTPEKVIVNAQVKKYFIDITKNGRKRHYIEFQDPKNNHRIQLEVYREYEEGEFFKKEMYYGKWGILFSRN